MHSQSNIEIKSEEDFEQDFDLQTKKLHGIKEDGSVYIINNVTLDTNNAVKYLNNMYKNEIDSKLELLLNLSRHLHPNIVKTVGLYKIENKNVDNNNQINSFQIRIAQEFYETTLLNYFKQRPDLSDEQCLDYLHQGFEALHFAKNECHVVHKSIKQGSIFIQGNYLKIGGWDDGKYNNIQTLINQNTFSDKNVPGSVIYAAPELKMFVENKQLDVTNFQEKDYHKADVFSFSLCVLSAFLKINEVRVLGLNNNKESLQRVIEQIKCEKLKQVFIRTLNFNVIDRVTAYEAIYLITQKAKQPEQQQQENQEDQEEYTKEIIPSHIKMYSIDQLFSLYEQQQQHQNQQKAEENKQQELQSEHENQIDPDLIEFRGTVVETTAKSGNVKIYYSGQEKKVKYEGQLQNGMLNGRGVYHYENGDVYDGEFKKNQKHGKGTYLFHDQLRQYEGEWRYGEKHGQGTFTFKDTGVYEGEFKNDKIDGFGKFDSDLHLYEGDWRENEYFGEGKLDDKQEQSIYKGSFRHNKKHGYGELELQKRDFKYKGNFKFDELHGLGHLVVKDKFEYQGEFEKGQFSGQGTIKYDNKEYFIGYFKNNKQHGKFCKMFYQNNDLYIGDFEEGKKHGHGTYYFSDRKRVYQGQWRHGKKHGEGEFTYSDGTTYKGKFNHGQKEEQEDDQQK